ncbi:putative histidine acid phosphatase [Penicillium brasilianum]|uniref:Putative histidine acid phosphatase n=1 Tax=Penicillium brasilianum TaxID=104259 RepID=A0A1S9RUV9_PENBI|nr:putative histidine acid phosphatase [Penicillium brasilianum]
MLNRRYLALIPLWLQASLPVTAQAYTEKVWGVFAYTVHGDSTPNVLAEARPRFLSDYGANQLAAAGAAFRDRYLSSGEGFTVSDSAIQYISASVLDSKDVGIFSTTDQFNIASAQAFMQGLYPPLGQSGMAPSDTGGNSSFDVSPLDGYQYPQIVTLGNGDPQSVMVAGQADCSMHQVAESEYRNGDYAREITEITDAFYVRLWHEVLSGVYAESSATYSNAVDIFDYIEYEAVHNSTVQTQLTEDEIRQARWWADHYTYATNGQSDSNSQSTISAVSPIAGQTLATSILRAFDLNIEKFGTAQKMTLLFGGAEPAVALASLLGLAAEQRPNFYTRPVRGASLVFELYSYEADEVYPTYPGIDNLYVRFFMHNGTNDTDFTSYSLFGYGPSHEYIPYSEFRSEVETFAVQSTQEWCLRCNSAAVFCTGVLDSSGSDSSKKNKGMAPAVAGVIGAVVTLAVIGLLVALGFFIWSRRKRQGNHKPSLGGFKGTDKLASDTDLTFKSPIWDASKSVHAEQNNDIASGVAVRGHERLGSWEMGQQKKEIDDVESASHRHMSTLEDENEDEWRIHSGLQPVKIRESV